MHRNYFTLYHAARELHEKLAGSRIDEVCTGKKDQVVLAFTLACGTCFQLFIFPGSRRLCMFAREGSRVKGKNSASILKECAGKSVSGVSISPFDREISINLEQSEHLILRFFGQESNILLVKENIVRDALHQKKNPEGTRYPETPAGEGIIRSLEKLALDRNLFIERFESKKKTDPAETVSAVLPGFDRSLARKLLESTGGGNCPETMYEMFRTVFYELLDPTASVKEMETGEPVFSILPGQPENTVTFPSVLEGLAFYSISTLKFIETRDELKIFRDRVIRQLGKKKKELAAYDPEMLEKLSRDYEACGHLLMASLGNEGKGRKSITVSNFFETDTADKTIELKEALTLRENAEAYFSKAAKTRARVAVMKERHALLEREKIVLEKTIGTLESIENPKNARRFLEEHEVKKPVAGNNKPVSPFRSVQISPKATLFIGKNAENNDQLTFGHAKPDDIWLHARGSSGSHCVLKGSGMDHLDDIKKAASIAAWHSSAKHSELVPVIYTFRKYVRRMKKSAKGQVIVEREKVLFVRPSREVD